MTTKPRSPTPRRVMPHRQTLLAAAKVLRFESRIIFNCNTLRGRWVLDDDDTIQEHRRWTEYRSLAAALARMASGPTVTKPRKRPRR